MYCKSNSKIIISRNVRFLENSFNFSNGENNDDQFFIEIQEICEPEGDDEDDDTSNGIDSHISNVPCTSTDDIPGISNGSNVSTEATEQEDDNLDDSNEGNRTIVR